MRARLDIKSSQNPARPFADAVTRVDELHVDQLTRLLAADFSVKEQCR